MAKKVPEDIVNELFAEPDLKIISDRSLRIATTKTGLTLSEEAKLKISQANKGRIPDASVREKMRASHIARGPSPGTLIGIKKAGARAREIKLEASKANVICANCGKSIHPTRLTAHMETHSCKKAAEYARRGRIQAEKRLLVKQAKLEAIEKRQKEKEARLQAKTDAALLKARIAEARLKSKANNIQSDAKRAYKEINPRSTSRIGKPTGRSPTPAVLEAFLRQARQPKSEAHKEALRNRVVSEVTRQKLRDKARARAQLLSESDREKLRLACLANPLMRKPTPESIAKAAAANRGRKRSEEAKANMKKGAAKRIWPIKTCPHCQITATAYPNFLRYHFDNCKHKEVS